MSTLLRSVLSLGMLVGLSAPSFAADDKSCHDLAESHKHIDEAIKNLEHHRDQGKRASIIDALKTAKTDLDAEKTNLGCK